MTYYSTIYQVIDISKWNEWQIIICLGNFFIWYSELLEILNIECEEEEEGEREMENLHLSNCWCLWLMRSLVNCAYAAVWKLMVCLLNRRVSVLWTPILCKIGFRGSESGAECIPCLLSLVLFTLIGASFWVDDVLRGWDSETKSPGFQIWLFLLIRCCPWACCATVLCCLCL